MPTNQGTVRHSTAWLGGIPLGLLAAAALMGSMVAVGETIALVVGMALLASAFIVRDFRVGVILLIMLFPVSTSPYIPRSIAGITGLNPLNLLLMATLVALLFNGMARETWQRLAPKPLIWLYIIPITLAGLHGMRHVGEISPYFAEAGLIQFDTPATYLRDQLVRPMFEVLFAMLVGAAATRSRRVEYFVVPLMIAVVVSALMLFTYIHQTGMSLGELAGDHARAVLTPVGMHANSLGRMYVVAYAILLFTCIETPERHMRFMLLAVIAVLVVALVLTFSRSAFVGFALVNLWFVLSRRNPLMLILAALAVAVLFALLPEVVYERLSHGSDAGANEISAGRIDYIWLPLLPELANNLLFGQGHGAIQWVEPMRQGQMLLVGHPHNAYLQALLDMGLLGLLLLCAYFAHVWIGFRRLAKDMSLSPSARGFFNGASIGLLLFLVAGFTGSSLAPVLEQIFLWLAIGMMNGYRQLPAGKPA